MNPTRKHAHHTLSQTGSDSGRDISAEIAPPRSLTTSAQGEWYAQLVPARDEDRVVTRDLIDVPTAARRWLERAVDPAAGHPVAVVLTMRGQLLLGRWRHFAAHQVLSPRGFVWAARTRIVGLPVTGYDRFTSETGEMRWRLGGIVPVSTASGSDVTRSAAGRLAAEATALLPSAFDHARWSPTADADVATATWRIAEHAHRVHVRTTPDGRIANVWLMRWGNPDGREFRQRQFSVALEEHRRFGGIAIPTLVRAGWSGAGRGSGEFFRARIVDAVFLTS